MSVNSAYIIVKAYSLEKLVELANKEMYNGYAPAGSISSETNIVDDDVITTYYQPFIKVRMTMDDIDVDKFSVEWEQVRNTCKERVVADDGTTNCRIGGIPCDAKSCKRGFEFANSFIKEGKNIFKE